MDYEIEYNTHCPKCGNEFTHSRRCTNLLCEEGYIDESEEDFLLPGTNMVPCDDCNSTGYEWWCPKCGHELTPEEINSNDTDDFKRIERPTIVCLCGSTRFMEAFQKANLAETLAGNIVLSIGCNTRNDSEIFSLIPVEEQKKIKEQLDELHKRKIDLADEVMILNVGDYIGESTRSELNYAIVKEKVIRFLEPTKHDLPF
jgi:hypothetical protein